MTKPKIDNYRRALKTLEDAMVKPPSSQLERDGIIQRFEYCLEISWNSAKKVLDYQGFKTDTPRNVFRELARIGWIDNPEEWIEYLDSRNKTSHMYHEEIANELFKLVPKFLQSSLKLFATLEDKLK